MRKLRLEIVFQSLIFNLFWIFQILIAEMHLLTLSIAILIVHIIWSYYADAT